ncbi:hypothetical protein BRADI_2g06040v3 [Brachypodium distachyon]|uniref:RDRP C-terminal head domain-containing protein n=1 Tax=Brachypodium distachyon TaxID=15368 RepID=I1HCZ7_BRADI|nr:hypothetical protein BRADI_2g06040v3 [Brachypodium distachyon]
MALKWLVVTKSKVNIFAEIQLDQCFMERAIASELEQFWACLYQEYLTESGMLIDVQDKDLKFQELYQKYKHVLYHAAEFEQSPRDLNDVFDEACVIYQIVYKRVQATKKAGSCAFVWNVAGRALCHFYSLGSEGDKVLVPLPVAQNLLTKRRR